MDPRTRAEMVVAQRAGISCGRRCPGRFDIHAAGETIVFLSSCKDFPASTSRKCQDSRPVRTRRLVSLLDRYVRIARLMTLCQVRIAGEVLEHV